MTELCEHLNNWFYRKDDVHDGEFIVTGGSLSVDFLQVGQYYRIIGSLWNDGVHVYGAEDDTLKDETFKGEIWPMRVPNAVVTLWDEITTWVSNNAPSALTSESFGGYSYSKAADASGAAASWQTVFRSRLNPWRKLK